MKRFVCDRCKAPIRKRNIVCYSCGYANIHLTRKLRIARILKAAVAIVLIVGVIALCNFLMLLPWQWGARRNRDVILKYAEEHYPDAKIICKELNSAKFFIWNNFEDCIVFDFDDLEFGITAEGGKILADGYCGARAIAQFDKIIRDGFLKPRGITAYTSYRFQDNYYEIYPYTGGLSVRITIWDQGLTPEEVGWLYDFYKYWRSEGDFLTSYSVRIDIVANDDVVYHIDYLNDDEYSDETAFYSAFKAGH